MLGMIFFIPIASAQQTPRASISGRVVDDSTSTPLFDVNVFVGNTTLGCSTDQNGKFEIRNVPLGMYEIIASRVGYTLYTSRARVTEAGIRKLEIRLKPTIVQMGEVVVAASDQAEWRKHLDRFDELFLGTSQNAEQCSILNPEVLDFESDDPSTLDATARRPLEIENRALGYHIQFVLEAFKVQNDVMTVEGEPKFTELKASAAKQQAQWKESRLRAFKGSLRHFLISLFHRQLAENGFSIYLVGSLQRGQDNIRKLIKVDQILIGLPRPYEKMLSFTGYLEVEYEGEVERGFDLLRRPGTTGQVSWLILNYNFVTITQNGLIDEQFPTKVYGYWAWERMADALPLDYEPEKN
jgi:hypothetical protein